MVTSNLGRLQKADLREAWASESSHFTPWLAQEENLQLLGESIGIELELESQEKEVGPFRADILCKDTANDTWVLATIKNFKCLQNSVTLDLSSGLNVLVGDNASGKSTIAAF